MSRGGGTSSDGVPLTVAAPVSGMGSLDGRMYQQALFGGYALGISVFSPAMNLYQVTKLHPAAKPAASYLRLCSSIYPHQVALRLLQVNLATPVKERLDPWLAFAVLGVLQGGVYGQANVSFARLLGISKTVRFRDVVRGSGYAASRDMISQGVPFMFSKRVSEALFDPFLPDNDAVTHSIKHWTSVLGTSIIATYLARNPSLGYKAALQSMYAQHGIRFAWKGAEARVGLLLITNVFNEIFLKPAWDER